MSQIDKQGLSEELDKEIEEWLDSLQVDEVFITSGYWFNDELKRFISQAIVKAKESERDNFMEWLPDMLGIQPMDELEKVEDIVQEAINNEYAAMADSL
jgi:hypothetical protein